MPPDCIQCEALVQHDPVAGGVISHHSVPTAGVRKPWTQQEGGVRGGESGMVLGASGVGTAVTEQIVHSF
jgi:hypothetical protein